MGPPTTSSCEPKHALSTLGRVLLAVTAAAPMFAFYAVVGLYTGDVGASVWFATGLFVSLLILWLLVSATLSSKRAPQPRPLSAQKLKTRETELLGISIAYLLPIATEGPAGLSPPVFSVVVLMFAGLVAMTHSYHVNPMLVLFGWRFYEIETEAHVTYTLLSRRHIRKPHEVSAGVQLGPFLWLDRSKQP